MNAKKLECLFFLCNEFAPLGLSNYTLADTLLKLKRLSNKLDKYNEIYCNRQMTEAEKTDREKTEKKAIDICTNVLKCGVEINTDPRGLAVGLLLNSKRYNNAGETWTLAF